jgi:hypothetical protein
MIGYYYIEETSAAIDTAAANANLRPTQWFSPGPMWDASCWMYNHKKPGDPPYNQYRPDRGIQEIDHAKLYAKADSIILASGWEGPTTEFDGYLCPNYEDYLCMTHPGPERNLPPEASFRNHLRLIELMRGRYPKAKLANWGLPQFDNPWGNYSLMGYQMMGQLTQMYDYGAGSCYTTGRENDMEIIQDRVNWFTRWNKPLVIYVSPWERHRTVHGGDGKWHPMTQAKLTQVIDIAEASPNVVGMEMWSMCRHHYIDKGWMDDIITHPSHIDQQHIFCLALLGKELRL